MRTLIAAICANSICQTHMFTDISAVHADTVFPDMFLCVCSITAEAFMPVFGRITAPCIAVDVVMLSAQKYPAFHAETFRNPAMYTLVTANGTSSVQVTPVMEFLIFFIATKTFMVVFIPIAAPC